MTVPCGGFQVSPVSTDSRRSGFFSLPSMFYRADLRLQTFKYRYDSLKNNNTITELTICNDQYHFHEKLKCTSRVAILYNEDNKSRRLFSL